MPAIGQPLARTAIEVAAADVNGVVLTARPLPSIDLPGKLTYRDNSRPESVRVLLRGDFLGDGRAIADADGTFVVKGLIPGRYRISVLTQSAPKSPFWDGEPISALLDGREVLFDGFDVGLTSPGSLNITMGTRSVLIAGKLSDGSGQPVMYARVALVPVQRGNGGSAVTDSEGQFKLHLVTASDYHVYLQTNLDSDSPFTNLDYLAAHAGDYPVVHVAAGANPALILTLRP